MRRLCDIDVSEEYIPPKTVEVNYITAYSCQFLLHFSSETKISDLSGVIVTNIKEEAVGYLEEIIW